MAQQGGCIFCRIARGEIPTNKVYEDQDVIAFLDINPASVGHTLVVSKEHFDDFTKAPKDVVSHVFQVAQLIAQACLVELKADGVNVITNIGKAAGQSIGHFHVHVIPRYANDRIGIPFGKTLSLPSDQFPQLADSIRKGLPAPKLEGK